MARCVKCNELVGECKCSFRTEYKGKPAKAEKSKPASGKVEK